ncbi:hypothetical protein [Nocardia sp. NPDC052316]|uniref:hypothetical protein n=1 Tax=Nocardia sp. NPDC052316 TaxID=3364329 RepID=UPI0037C8F55C
MVFETAPAVATSAPPANALLAVLKRRWPTVAGVLLALAFAAPEVSWIGVTVLIGAAVAYPAFGLYRGHLHGRTVLLVQSAAFVAFVGLAVVILLVDVTLGSYLLAAGFLAHGIWDFAHHRADRMVPRWYAEFCAVIDVLIALFLVLGAVTSG